MRIVFFIEYVIIYVMLFFFFLVYLILIFFCLKYLIYFMICYKLGIRGSKKERWGGENLGGVGSDVEYKYI